MIKDGIVADVAKERKRICASIMRCYNKNVARVERFLEEREKLRCKLQVYALQFMEHRVLAELQKWNGELDILSVRFSWEKIYKGFLESLPDTEQDSVDEFFPDGFSLHKEGEERVQSDLVLLFGVLRSEGVNMEAGANAQCKYHFQWKFFLPKE